MERNVSRQIVDDEHIRVMVWAGLRPHPSTCPLTWHVDGPDGRQRRQLEERDAAQIGAMLHDQNIAAYEERYGDFGEPGQDDNDDDDDDFDQAPRPYGHAAPQHTGWTQIDLFDAVQFYVYQSFHDEEHDDATSSDALMFCGALVRRLGPDLPGWGDPSFPEALMRSPRWPSRPWGITGDTTPR